MNKTKKIAISVSSVFVVLLILFLAVRFFTDNSYRNQIPELPDSTTVPVHVKEQLDLAREKAMNHPMSDNIGLLGMAFHSSAYYDQAKQCYTLAIKQDKSKWIWSYYLGYLEQEMGDSKSAIENFNAVIKENPEITTVWLYLGKAYQNLTEVDKAEETLNKIAYLKDDISDLRSVRVNYFSLPTSAKFELARIYLNTKQLDKAEKMLIDVIKQNHTVGSIYRLLSNVYSAKGDSVLSKKYVVRAQDLAETAFIKDTIIDRLALISRSEQYLPKRIDDAIKNANLEGALQLFRHALRYLHEDKYLISKAIKFFLPIKRGEEILPYLNSNFNNFKDDLKEMNSIAEVLFLNGFYSQAIPYYTQVEKLSPGANLQLANFAMCYWNQNKKDSALIMMNEQYEKNKNNPIVLASEVDFMLRIGEMGKAKSYLAKLRHIAPANSKAIKLSGLIAEMEGNQNVAIEMYRAVFNSDPNDLEAIQKLGNIFLDQKKWSEAISFARISLKYNPNAYFLLERLGTFLVSCPDQKLRNVPEGMELSLRAFYNISSPPYTLIYSSKSLAQAYAMYADFPNASYFIQTSISMAKSEKISESYMQELMFISNRIKQYSKQK
ncbi:MAG: tetratricopeptide repeat protein [Prolixibacteraceae bacterium]|nr:tetratricopeptide repeat protein [Prolixibacteraceae bacterium]